MLANAIFSGLYESQFGNMFKEIFSNPGQRANAIPLFGERYFMVLLFTLLNISAMQTSIIAYMKVYSTKDELPVIEEVWAEFKKYYLQILFYSIPIYLLIIIGMIFCLAPGIYLGVVLMPFPIIIMVEDETLGGAFSRCFAIIKTNFWPSFGIYIIAYLIYAFSAMIISTVVGVVAGLLSYFTTQDISKTVGIVTSILSISSHLFYIIFFVSAVLNYFSLAEKHDGTGILQRLDKIGNSDNNFDNTQEQY